MKNSPVHIGHIAVAVKNLKEAAEAAKKIFGVSLSSVEEVPTQKIRLQFAEIGGVRFEFLEPTSEDSPISKFLEKRGPGIHHISFETNEIAKRLDNLKKDGVPLINEKPVPGAEECDVAFLHPKAFLGVLVEFMQKRGS